MVKFIVMDSVPDSLLFRMLMFSYWFLFLFAYVMVDTVTFYLVHIFSCIFGAFDVLEVIDGLFCIYVR